MPQRASFSVQAADAASAAREASHPPGELAPSKASRRAQLALPAALDRASWRQFVILCPQEEATPVLDTLALEAQPAAAVASRSSRIWERAAWRDDAEGLLAWAGREKIKELFIVVTLDGAQVREPARLAAFVRRAGRAGIAVTAVEGDPHMVLPNHRAATVDRARAYAAYNRAVAPDERLRAMQFDIEPYLLDDDVLAPRDRDHVYLDTARALHEAAAGTPLEFVVPFWWSDKTELLDGLASAADAIAVMDYRTDPEQIVRFAVPFLDWGARYGKRVRIALEAGKVGAEVQRRYVRADDGEAGELLLAELDGARALVLLRAPVKEATLPRYRLSGERTLDGSATSFYGQRDALRKLLPGLERDFSAWPGFAGIALHGWR
ncbi:hypothetical protein [Massilia sp. Se16.2.3]|uniref:hypothetical protein n=1 Tax=Massilia sp. Se16.2.3 TaxID=2709303 RepID=UPI001602B7A0|nr:hypothetical protein [Massilia sp. Se16.2.3]QNB00558.1 hypothetical protein G4G31_20040 [Massilia sp. Se16.2.3]